MVRILLVLSGSDHWTLTDGTHHPTGYWAEEFVVPHRIFRRQGAEVCVATPGGVRPTVDQVSLDPQSAKGKAAGESPGSGTRSFTVQIVRVLETLLCYGLRWQGVRGPGGRPWILRPLPRRLA
jgi:hypothetical protein